MARSFLRRVNRGATGMCGETGIKSGASGISGPDSVQEFLSTAMNKRTFLKICSAAMASPFLSRLTAWAAEEKLHNWAGNVEYGTDRVFSAGSVEAVQEFVRKQSKLKVLGTRTASTTLPTATTSSSR